MEGKILFVKSFLLFLSVLLISFLFFSVNAEAATLQVLNQNNTTLVPLRTISEELGAQVSYQKDTNKITVIYKDIIIETTIGSKTATVNNIKRELLVAPRLEKGTTYVPIRFIGEALGGTVDYKDGRLKISLDGRTKEWKLETINIASSAANLQSAFKSGTKTVNGKKITYVTINMNDPRIKVKIATANNTVTQAQALKTLAGGAKAAVNGTYFAAYNGAIPLPDGTIVSNGRALHITDIGSTIGVTSDNKVLIDFVQTRVQGYINGEEAWISYRVNRPTTDPTATIIYTPEYGREIPLAAGWSAVICVNGKVEEIVKETRKVPSNGFILVTKNPDKFKVGDAITLKTIYNPTHTSASDWEKVIYALSAGPSLRINGQKTGDPRNENFTEAKIVSNVAQRTFIGVTNDNILMIGTVTASISQLKDIVAQLGLKSAMCLDGGASSGLYYDGKYLTTPGRNLSNSINFYY